MNENIEAGITNTNKENDHRRKSFYEKSLSSILDTITDFPDNSKLCQERTRNSELECAVDFITVIQAHLQIINHLNEGAGDLKYHGQDEFLEFEKEIRCLGQEIRGVLDNNYESFLADMSREEVARKKKEDVAFVLDKLKKKAEEIKAFIERMTLLPKT